MEPPTVSIPNWRLQLLHIPDFVSIKFCFGSPLPASFLFILDLMLRMICRLPISNQKITQVVFLLPISVHIDPVSLLAFSNDAFWSRVVLVFFVDFSYQ